MNRKERLARAKHNEEVSKYLTNQVKYSDWVVTCAFYSALHYIEYKGFPLNLAGKSKKNQIRSIGHYRSAMGLSCSLHEARHHLVKNHHPAIATTYQQLYDLCHTARYRKYSSNKKDADVALKWLQIIKNHCTTP